MKKWIVALCAILAILPPSAVYADTAQRTDALVYINTDKADAASRKAMGVMTVYTYNINDNNYFMLRDIAQMLSAHEAGFAIEWDDKNGIIEIDTNRPYASIGNELDRNRHNQNILIECYPQETTVIVNGKPLKTAAYNIGGNMYFQLRDLGDFIGFEVNWLESAKAIQILTKAQPVPTSNTIPEHFTPGGLAATTNNVGSYTFEGVIGADQYQFGNPIPIDKGNHLTFKLDLLEYASGDTMAEDESVLRVVYSGNEENNRLGFNFTPRGLYITPGSFPISETANYHITLINLSGKEVKYRFTASIEYLGE